MKKHSIFLMISAAAFLLTIVTPVLLGIFSADDVLMWKAFGLFAAVSIVSFWIWIILLLIHKIKAAEVKPESSHKKYIGFIAAAALLIFVLLILNFFNY